MNNIHIITGAPLTGKTQYIKSNYSDSSKYYHLDYSKTFLELFGSLENETDQKTCDVRNTQTEELFDYRLGDHELVFEFCTGFEKTDKALLKILASLKAKNIPVNVIELTCTEEEALKRNEQVKSDPTYYSSYHLNNELIEFLPHFIGDIRLANELSSD